MKWEEAKPKLTALVEKSKTATPEEKIAIAKEMWAIHNEINLPDDNRPLVMPR